MFNREAEWVFPIVKDLPTQKVATDSPIVASTRSKQWFAAGHEVIEVGNFPRAMAKTSFASFQNE
jgi:hypothetical protein